MKKYELTIVVNVDDDVKDSDFAIYDHDVCDGFEVLLNLTGDKFRLSAFELTGVKELPKAKITDDDILAVAKRLEIELTGNQLNWVKLSYEDAMRQDPTATWNLIVEDLIYCIKNNFN